MRTAFSKDAEELLAGLGAGPARRGQTVLRLIQARVADCRASRAGHPSGLYRGDSLRDTRNLAYLGAVATGVQNPGHPGCTIQELERYAPDWADLVPRSPAIRADLARRLAETYAFEAKHVPGIIAALQLDDARTAEEFRALCGKELATVFATSTPVRETLRWARSATIHWVENLPAFWASFALTITSTLGPSVLALPIVFMSFGPLAAALMVLAIGGLNTLTLAYLAESQLRGGPVLRKQGFNQIIEHYLGAAALNFLKICLFLYCIVVLFAFTGGFLDAIASTLGTSGTLWFAGLYLFVLWYLLPHNTTGSLVSAFAIALVNLTIISGFTFAILFAASTPPPAGITGGTDLARPFAEIPVQIAIGAALYSFAGHISVSNSARLVLRRRNSGKGFLRGAVSGLGAISVIYAIWTFAAISALTSGALPQSDSILQSISLVFGPWASMASVVFIVLSLGIGAGNYAMGAHLVLVDTFRRVRRHRDSRGLRPPRSAASVIRSRDHLAGITVISLVMGAALGAYVLGLVDLNRFFGLIGGLMAPVIAGVFPILIFVACRRRGVSSQSQVRAVLSGRSALLFCLIAFVSAYVWQAASDHYALWYRGLSAGLCISVLGLLWRLYRRGTFRAGGVVLIVKDKDGWDPADWKVFESGREVTDRPFFWKTSESGDFHRISQDTNPARMLTAVRLDTGQMSAGSFDVNVVDKTTRHPVGFTVSKDDPACLEIVIAR